MATRAKARSALDEDAFVAEVAHLRQQGDSLEAAVLKVWRSYELDEDLLFRATSDGLCRIAAGRLGTEPRREILNSVKVRVLPAPDPEPVAVEVHMSPLREWPVFGVEARVLNECTTSELLTLERHLERTWRAVGKRYRVIRAVRLLMEARGVERVADLSDEELQRCLEQAEED
jgi:hypothetical protein